MPRTKPVCLLLVLLLLSIAPRAHGQRRRAEPFDVLHYQFDVRLEDSTNQIKARAEITILYPSAPPAFTNLDLAHRSGNGLGMAISSLTVDGGPASFSHGSNLIKITTPARAQKGDTVIVQLAYSGVPDNGLVISKNYHGARTFFAEHWPNRAHRWLPVVDHPSEKATCGFAVTAPAKYQVVANGRKQSEDMIDGGYKTTVWEMDRRIPAKVMVIGVAEFKTQTLDENGKITAWVYGQSGDGALNDFSDTPAILGILTGLMGEYPYTKCDQVESTTRFGGMENAGNIFYPERSLTGEHKINITIAHEIGHHWFGNTVSEADWADVWISEGFATFLAYYFVLEFQGPDGLRAKLDADEEKVLDYQRRFPGQTVVQKNIASLEDILNPLTYEKAAWVLRALNQKVGDGAFRKIVLAFYGRYKFGNASTQDFIDVANEISPIGLSTFFDQWLYVPGAPKVEYSWEYRKGKLTVRFDQKSDHVYQLDLDIQLKYENMGFETKRVQLTEKKQTVEVLCKRPTGLVVDPLNVILGKFSEK